jgi:hypothetical protein
MDIELDDRPMIPRVPEGLTNLNFETLIKCYFEPIIVHYIPQVEQYLRNYGKKTYPDVNLVMRGGSALTYYYSNDISINTHDFDIGVVIFPPIDEMVYLNDNDFTDHVLNALTILEEKLNSFNNPNNVTGHSPSDFFKSVFPGSNVDMIKFKAVKTNVRLYTLQFIYEYNDQTLTASLVDLFIYGLSSFTPWLAPIEENLKLTSEQIIERRPYIKTYISDYISSIVVDKESGLKFIGLGSLMNDTVRMLEYSINAKNDYARNKTSRYIKKYVLLITVINNMLDEIDCDEPQMINGMRVVNCSRNMNKDCMNNKIQDPQKLNNSMNIKLLKFYRNSNRSFLKQIINKVPFNLKCAMYRVLSNMKDDSETSKINELMNA